MPELRVTALSLVVGGLGAALGWLVSMPLYLLTGPALLVSALSLLGFRFAIATGVRDVAFLFIGIGVGAGVNADAAAAVLRWPVAFVALAIMLVIAMAACRALLVRGFGFEPRTAVLASAPGHLSFVLALGESYRVDTAKVAVVQSVRLLLLTLAVPVIAAIMGLDLSQGMLPAGAELSLLHLAILCALGITLGWCLERLCVPAPLLIGAMIVSSLGHLSDLAPGVLNPQLTLVCLVVMGTLIGSRFSGTTPAQLAGYAGGGTAITCLTVGLSVLAAVPIALWLGMPIPHVLVAFAPGGLETMIVMGAVLGANPGFVAACHVGRLLILSILIPSFTARAGSDFSKKSDQNSS
ncbi:AbrB family transcriptional regulator [Litoreibacter ponti]|uniref:AbrB family transcriptional regulator n=1 Tax=Litoreibacter ponti TaxID=1510457 RepID=UPI001FE587C8|nr:AbrB family transcriptional regulator [Litoreibacter ponti]